MIVKIVFRLQVEQIDDTVRELASTPNLELSPHCAWYSEEAALELRTKCALACKRVLKKQPNENVVNNSPRAGGRGGRPRL